MFDSPCSCIAFMLRLSCLCEAGIYNWTDTKMAEAVENTAINRRGFGENVSISPVKDIFEEVDAFYKEEYPEANDDLDQVQPAADKPAPYADAFLVGTPQKIKELDQQIDTLTGDSKSVATGFRAQAKVLVKSLVQLVPEPDEENELYEILRCTTAMKICGNDSAKTNVLILYDMSQASESQTQAKHRTPGLRKDHYKKPLNAIIRARWAAHGDTQIGPKLDEEGNPVPPQTPNMVNQDVFAIYDGSKTGRDHSLFSIFYDNQKKPMKPRNEKAFHLAFSQADLLKRMDRDKGAFLDLSERIILVSSQVFTPLERPRIHWPDLGTARGNTWAQ